MRRRNVLALAAENRIRYTNSAPTDHALNGEIAMMVFQNVKRIHDFLPLKDLLSLKCAFPTRKSTPCMYYCTNGLCKKRKGSYPRQDVTYSVEDEYIFKRISQFMKFDDYVGAMDGLNLLTRFLQKTNQIDMSVDITRGESNQTEIRIYFDQHLLIRESISRSESKSVEFGIETHIVFKKFYLLTAKISNTFKFKMRSAGVLEDLSLKTDGFLLKPIMSDGNNLGNAIPNVYATHAFVTEIHDVLEKKMIDIRFGHYKRNEPMFDLSPKV